VAKSDEGEENLFQTHSREVVSEFDKKKSLNDKASVEVLKVETLMEASETK